MPSETSALEIVSHARRGPPENLKLTIGQIEQIRRTVRRVPEVMVKVTGGGRKVGAVAAQIAWFTPSASPLSDLGSLRIRVPDNHHAEVEVNLKLILPP